MSRLTTTQALATNVQSVPASLGISRPPSVTVVEGGLEIRNDAGTDGTLIANACAVVSLNLA